jgi:hypothetical protein
LSTIVNHISMIFSFAEAVSDAINLIRFIPSTRTKVSILIEILWKCSRIFFLISEDPTPHSLSSIPRLNALWFSFRLIELWTLKSQIPVCRDSWANSVGYFPDYHGDNWASAACTTTIRRPTLGWFPRSSMTEEYNECRDILTKFNSQVSVNKCMFWRMHCATTCKFKLPTEN